MRRAFLVSPALERGLGREPALPKRWAGFRVRVASATLVVALVAPTKPPSLPQESGEGPFGFPLSACQPEQVNAAKVDEHGKPVKDQQGNTVTETYSVQRCNGKAESFDGLPLSATLTLPVSAPLAADLRRPLPLIVLRHGSGEHKKTWQHNPEDDEGAIPAWKNDWNDAAFAKRGYAVLTFTARGWLDSCGPQERAKPEFATKCEGLGGKPRHYWVHFSDPRWEVRDTQMLIGLLVDGGWVEPEKIGVYGFSMGGMEAWLLALLNNRTMHADGSLHRWRSPAGTPLRVAAAIPEGVFAAPAHGWAPNGRGRDEPVPDLEQLTQPFGVVLGEVGAGCALIPSEASLAPPGADPTADWASWCRRLAQGNPFRPDPVRDPVLFGFVEQMRFRSALGFGPSRPRVPVFMWQGLTDALTTGTHGVMMLNRLRDLDRTYPIKASFHDAGHAPAANTLDEYGPLQVAGNAFFDYHLRGRGEAPSYDVSATSPRCARDGKPVRLTKPRWRHLSGSAITPKLENPRAVGEVNQSTASHIPLPAAFRRDVPFQRLKPVCPEVQPVESAGAPTWTFSETERFVLAGAPELTLSYSGTGTDAQISVRLWDVAPEAKGSTQKLISRGIYRHEGDVGNDHKASFQLWPQVWPMDEGHRLRLEITGNDMPYLQQNNTPFVLHITGVELSIPRA